MLTLKHTTSGSFEYIYLVGLVQYANVYKPRLAYKSKTDYEYSINIFVDKEDVTACDDIPLNKTFFEVGVDKNKKKAIKYPLETHQEFEGKFGCGINRPAENKQGVKAFITVIDIDRKPFKKLIGNGSKVKIKCFGWRNEDGLLSINLDTLQVLEHVPYVENNIVTDDEFGGAYEREVGASAAQDDEDDMSPVSDDDDEEGKY